MKQRELDAVLAALEKLGCSVYLRADFAVFIQRGAVKIARLRWLSPVPSKVQRDLIARLEIDEADYLAAFDD